MGWFVAQRHLDERKVVYLVETPETGTVYFWQSDIDGCLEWTSVEGARPYADLLNTKLRQASEPYVVNVVEAVRAGDH